MSRTYVNSSLSYPGLVDVLAARSVVNSQFNAFFALTVGFYKFGVRLALIEKSGKPRESLRRDRLYESR